jgi:hypothetical protein
MLGGGGDTIRDPRNVSEVEHSFGGDSIEVHI